MEEKQKKQEKIDYVKPEVLDLGPVTAIYGDTCSPSGLLAGCGPGGTAQITDCDNGPGVVGPL